MEIIAEYDIRYIVSGETERTYSTISGNVCIPGGSPARIAALDGMDREELEKVFSLGSTQVHRARDERLWTWTIRVSDIRRIEGASLTENTN